MTVSMATTRLSLVMTGCGGKLTTCSRRSMSGSSRSTNGVTMFRPAFRVRWYRPKRSTMPALACGMILIDLAIATTITTMTTMSRMVATRVLMAAPLLRPELGGVFRVRLLRYRPQADSASSGHSACPGGPA